MRVLLLHNPKAGHGEHSAEELMAHLSTAGHETLYRSTKKEGWDEPIDDTIDVVVVAGGDGTVGKVARSLVDRKIPLAVVPLGTANNLARTLGFTASPRELFAALDAGKRQSFDVGIATGPWGERMFFEGAGAGLLPDYFRALATAGEKETKALSPGERVALHVSVLAEILPDYADAEWQVTVDGEDLSGSYFLLEVMNIRSLGPVLTLAPDADPSDGHFDFIAVNERNRLALDEYVEARANGHDPRFPLLPRRCRHVRLVGEGSALHYDDEVWPKEGEKKPPRRPGPVEITIMPAALEVLLFGQAARANRG